MFEGRPGQTDRSLQRALRDHGVGPERVHELLLRHRAVPPLDEENEKGERLRLDGYRLASAPQLPLANVDLVLPEAKYPARTRRLRHDANGIMNSRDQRSGSGDPNELKTKRSVSPR